MPDPGGLRRRHVLALGAGAFVVAALPLVRGATRRTERRAYRRTLPVMGTIADCVVVTGDAKQARLALDAACTELRAVDTLMSRFRADSDVGRANAAAGRDVSPVTPATAFVLRHALSWAERTDGRFDPCLGRLTEAYSPSMFDGAPSQPALSGRSSGALWRELDLGVHGGRDVVRLATHDAAIDLGGIAKGHAVDRALAAIRALGVHDAFVNAGGDLAAAGRSTDGDPWHVGVRDPSDPNGICDTLDLTDEAVATSGDYETARRVGGTLVHHLLDPRTGRPRPTGAGTHSLTIVAPTCIAADAAATALFGTVPGSDEGSRLLRGTGARIASRA